MLTVSLLVCAMIALARANDNSTEEGNSTRALPWHDFNGRSYLFVSRELKWIDAELNCLSMNANLASVNNAVEYHFIQDLIKSVSKDTPETWVGGSDCQKTGIWLWSDGTGFSFSMWGTGKPDNSNNDSHCIQINHAEKKLWDDAYCANSRPSVCAKRL